MIDQTLVEGIWSLSGVDPAYLAEMRRVCLPTGTAVSTSSGLLAELPRLFCELHGGTHLQVIPVITAWTLLRYAARILDDVEDSVSNPAESLRPMLLEHIYGFDIYGWDGTEFLGRVYCFQYGRH